MQLGHAINLRMYPRVLHPTPKVALKKSNPPPNRAALGPDSSKSDGTHSTIMDPVPLVYIGKNAQCQRLAGLITCKKVTKTRSDAEDRRLKERESNTFTGCCLIDEY